MAETERRVGRYRIVREIGRGGMAAVYEAENVDIGKRVAIKVLAQELTTSAIVLHAACALVADADTGEVAVGELDEPCCGGEEVEACIVL